MLKGDVECKVYSDTEIDLELIESFPVEVLYTDRKSNVSNVLKFESYDEIAKFIALRKYLLKRLGGRKELVGQISIWS